MSPEPNLPGSFGGLRILAVVAAAALVFFAGRMDFAALDLADVSLRRLGELLATYLFLALLVERAVELILSWRFGAEEIAILTPLRQAAARNHAEMQMLARDMDMLVNPQDRMVMAEGNALRSASEARVSLPAQAAATRERLDGLSVHRRRWATWCSMGLSAALALAGFQMLHGAFAAQIDLSDLPEVQMQVFAFIDVGLTTVVLAGGAAGIHGLISRLLEFGRTSKTGITWSAP